MGKKIEIEPVTRVEGHAKVTIRLDEAGEVSDTELNILQVRGFEKFMEGRQIEYAPTISSRICGICSEAHHVCSAKAVDDLFGVEIPKPAEKLRKLLLFSGIIQSHVLHFFFLASPDFFSPKEKEKRNFMGIAKEKPDLTKKIIKARKETKKLVKDIGGKETHPATAVPGGMAKSLTEEQRKDHIEGMKSLLEFGVEGVKMVKRFLEEKEEFASSLGGVDSYQMGLVNDGYHELYDGKLRVMDSKSKIVEEFDPSNYQDHIGERVQPHSYMKFPYLKKVGFPEGGYRVNALPRINICQGFRTEKAQQLLEEFREKYGRPLQPLLYNYARNIEVVALAEQCIQLLEDESITGENIRSDVDIPEEKGEGIGVVEAPRGTLIHHYKAEGGVLTGANLIVATQHNNIPLENDLDYTAKRFIHNGEVDERILNNLEMIIRSYDPCLSCATHAIGGGFPVELQVVDEKGEVISSMKNFK